MAILQFFQSSPNEEQIFRTLKALARFLEVFDLVIHSLPLTAVNLFHFFSSGLARCGDDHSDDWTASKTVCRQK